MGPVGLGTNAARYGSKDRLDDILKIVIDLGVPEPQDPEAARGELAVADSVAAGMIVSAVLATIELDGDPVLQAGEVGDEGTDRDLAADV